MINLIIMNVEVLTKNDLNNFKLELIQEITFLLKPQIQSDPKWVKSATVKKMLQISSGTLQHLRATGQISYKKLGNIFYYSFKEVDALIEKEGSHV